MRRYQRIGDGAVLAQSAGGARLVEPHKPGIASHVGGQYRRQPAFDPTLPLAHHGVQTPLDGILHDKSDGAQHVPERLSAISSASLADAGDMAAYGTSAPSRDG